MSDTDTHSAAYCPVCLAKVKYQYPPAAGPEGRQRRMLVAMAAHWVEVGHPAPEGGQGA